MKIRTLIVDDEPLARDRIRRMLRDDAEIEIVGECGNGNDAVKKIRSDRPDLVFLDIQMPVKNGFEVIGSLRPDEAPAVIFVTAYDEYALRAFDVHALDYLLKPFKRERLERAVARARGQIALKHKGELDQRLSSLIADIKQDRKYLDRLVVRSAGRIFFLRTDEIDWIEAAGNYVKLHVGRESHMIRDTMNGIESRLDPDKFVRIHRSTVVNIDRIKELYPMFSGDYAVRLTSGTELTLSRNHRERFLELFEGKD